MTQLDKALKSYKAGAKVRDIVKYYKITHSMLLRAVRMDEKIENLIKLINVNN